MFIEKCYVLSSAPAERYVDVYLLPSYSIRGIQSLQRSGMFIEKCYVLSSAPAERYVDDYLLPSY